MIGRFYPFPVTSSTATAFNPVRVTATNAATELTNIIVWIVWNQSDRQ